MLFFNDKDKKYWVDISEKGSYLQIRLSNGSREVPVLLKKDGLVLPDDTEKKFYDRMSTNLPIVRNVFKRVEEAKKNPAEAGRLLKEAQYSVVHEFSLSLQKHEKDVTEKVKESKGKYYRRLGGAFVCGTAMIVSATYGIDGMSGMSSPLALYQNQIVNMFLIASTACTAYMAQNAKDEYEDAKDDLKKETFCKNQNEMIRSSIANSFEKSQKVSLDNFKEMLAIEPVVSKVLVRDVTEINKFKVMEI